MTLPKDKLKKLKKQLKKFKKVAKSDMREGMNLSKEISIDIDDLLILHGGSLKKKDLNILNKTKEMLKLYEGQMNAVMEFKQKWD